LTVALEVSDKAVMSAKSTESGVVVIKADDLVQTLRVSRSAAYEVLRKAGAVRVGERAVRLPVGRLVKQIGEELTSAVVAHAAARVGGR
jgi:hypothetical protein